MNWTRTATVLVTCFILATANGLAADPAVVRDYAFTEGSGQTVRELSGKSGWSLDIGANDPYLNDRLAKTLERQDYPSWTLGRSPSKGALSIGSARGSVCHSGFYTTGTNSLTVEMWIRTHADAGVNSQAVLASIGSGYYDGWKIVTGPYGTTFNLGRPVGSGPGKGVVGVSANKPLAGYIWHHLVAEIDGDAKAILIFVDGAPAGRTDFDGVYEQPTPPGSDAQTPELDRGGLILGANNSFKSELRFDIDELVVYRRALPADEVISHYNAGKTLESDDNQVRSCRALLADQERVAAIVLAMPTRSGYFASGEVLPVNAVIPAAEKQTGRWRCAVEVYDATGISLCRKNSTLNVSRNSPAAANIEIPAQQCGLYRVVAVLSDPFGKAIKSESFQIGVRKPQVPIAQMPPTAPIAHFGAINMHYEDLGVGGNFERCIQPWCPLLPSGGYDWTYSDLYVNTALDNGLVPFYTLGAPLSSRGFKTTKQMADDLTAWEDWVRQVATHFKGRVHYWEVLNEPNANGQITAAEYVMLQKSAYGVLKEVDPTNKVAGICGTANFADWTEDVLAAGGGKYLDILSFHNYLGTSPISSRNRYHKVERVVAAVEKYIGHPVPLWNGECGIHQPVRVNGRPMTDDEMLAAYAGRSTTKDGWATAGVDAIMMTTEHRCACWQVQSILMDLASGAQKYFLLMGSNRYYPETDATGQGLPSEKGIALAALGSVTTNMTGIRYLPLSAGSSTGVMIDERDGTKTVALFADSKLSLSFVAQGRQEFRGMDFLGNAKTWRAQNGRLNLTLGDEPLYLFDVPSSFEETRMLRVTRFPEQLSPGTTAAGEITLTNTTDQSLSGSLALSSDGCKIDPVGAVAVPAGERKTVEFTVHAQDLPRGVHVLAGQFVQNGVVLSRTEREFTSEGMAIPVHMTSRNLTLDGDPAIWTASAAERADQASQVVIGRPDVGVADKRWWQGPSELSYTVKSMWRAGDGLYLLINVDTNVLSAAPKGKENIGYFWDCIELFFDGRTLKTQTAAYSAGAQQVIVVPNITDTLAPCAIVSFARPASTIDAKFVGKRTSTGYMIEGRIAPLAGSAFTLAAGTHFGMDIAVDDADGGSRRIQMALHGTEKDCFDTSAWGVYELMP